MDIIQQELPFLESGHAPEVVDVGVAALIKYLALGPSGTDVPCVLLAERMTPGGLGRLTFPGGRVEEGETVLECVGREVLEETGAEIDLFVFTAALRNPCLVRSGSEDWRLHMFFGYWDEIFRRKLPQTTEPLTLAPWFWVPITKIISNAFSGDLPVQLLRGWWIDEAINAQEYELDRTC